MFNNWERPLVRLMVLIQPFAVAGLTIERSGSLTEKLLSGGVQTQLIIAALGACVLAVFYDLIFYMRKRRTLFTPHLPGIFIFMAALMFATTIMTTITTTSIILPTIYAWSSLSLLWTGYGIAHNYGSQRNRNIDVSG